MKGLEKRIVSLREDLDREKLRVMEMKKTAEQVCAQNIHPPKDYSLLNFNSPVILEKISTNGRGKWNVYDKYDIENRSRSANLGCVYGVSKKVGELRETASNSRYYQVNLSLSVYFNHTFNEML